MITIRSAVILLNSKASSLGQNLLIVHMLTIHPGASRRCIPQLTFLKADFPLSATLFMERRAYRVQISAGFPIRFHIMANADIKIFAWNILFVGVKIINDEAKLGLDESTGNQSCISKQRRWTCRKLWPHRGCFKNGKPFNKIMTFHLPQCHFLIPLASYSMETRPLAH